MIEFLEKTEDPLLIRFKVNFECSNEKVLIIWEDAKSLIPQHSDFLTINKHIVYYCSINKPIVFFKNNLNFKIISLKTYEVLFCYTFRNLSFLKEKKILYISQNNHSGYSYAARNYIYQLLESGYDVTWDTSKFGNSSYLPCNEYEQKVFDCLNKQIDYDSVIIHHIPDAWSNIAKTIPRDKKIYGLTTWETTKLHCDWVGFINNSGVDEIIVPSFFNQDIFKNSGVNKKINVWLHDIFPFTKNNNIDIYRLFSKFYLYDANEYYNNVSYIKDIIDKKTVYYNISQYNERKNIDQIIKTFCTKFKGNRDVCLFIKTFFKEFTECQTEMLKYRLINILKDYDDVPSVVLCFDDLNSDEVNCIHEFGDVYFSLSRGEGFGLCTYTAKKIGNRVICGKFGAEKEFTDSKDILLNYNLVNTFNMEVYHNWYENQQWADYDNDDVLSKLEYFPKTKKKLFNYS